MGKIINVKEMVEESKTLLKSKVAKIKDSGINPKLAVIIANDLESTRLYVKNKKKLGKELGIEVEVFEYGKEVTNEELLEKIDSLNKDKSVHGILVQLPLYPHLKEDLVIYKIDKEKDVDCFNPYNVGNLLLGKTKLYPCTPRGILKILENLEVNLEGKHAVVVGRSNIVGKPIAQLLLSKNATVTICHSKTKNLENETKRADILIVAIGVAKYIKKEMVKENAIVIDVGINRVDGKVVGDVDLEDCLEKVKYITKVPGGVGLSTVISVMENLCYLIENK